MCQLPNCPLNWQEESGFGEGYSREGRYGRVISLGRFVCSNLGGKYLGWVGWVNRENDCLATKYILNKK